MKTATVVAGSLVAGMALGIGITAARFELAYAGSDLARMLGTSDERVPELPPEAGPQPRVSVDREQHDFGTMERGATASHAFRFTNAGDFPLELEQGDTTCKCTISKLDDERVAPGESVDVVLEWSATTSARQFRQSATILTNDPQRRRINLTVEGRIEQSLVVEPPEIVFSRLRSDERRESSVRVLSFKQPDLTVLGHAFGDAVTAEQFELNVAQLSGDALGDPDALSGIEVTVAVRPGMPVGPIRQRVELTTNAAGKSAIEIPIYGRVTSDVSIFGRGWDAARGVLALGTIARAEGGRSELTVFVRGDRPERFELRTASVKPDLLRVTVGEPTTIKGGAVTKVPLVVEVPPGSRPANHLGSDLAPLGEILLETNHPEARQLRMLVRFAVGD